MKVEPFIKSFRDINKSFIDLVDTLSALSALSELKIEIDNETSLLKMALHLLAENVDLESCSIYTIKGENLECAAGLGWQDLRSNEEAGSRSPMTQSMVFRVGEGMVGLAVSSGILQVSNDCLSDQRVVRLAEIWKERLVGSIMSAPIRSGAHIMGALNISHRDTNHFNETHKRLLTLFSNFLGQILANWRHVNNMQEQVRQRTVQLENALNEAQHLKERYEALSIVDDLTGLHNRRFFFPEAQAALAGSVRYGHPYSLMLVDLDHFKGINDTYGHVVGDKVLKGVSDILKAHIRECDILCRFGGEEFIIALPNTDRTGVQALSSRIHDALRDTSWLSDGRTFKVTLTIGVSISNNRRELKARDVDIAGWLEELLKQADQALYCGKENGRSQTRLHGIKLETCVNEKAG